MKKIKLNRLFFLGFFSLIVGCGGGGVNSATDLEEVEAEKLVEIKNIEQSIVGYWTSASTANPEYEFFASAFEQDFASSIQQGRIFEGGKQVNSFYWQLQSDGVIRLTLVDTLCNVRPLNLCQAIGVVKIRATGRSLSNATWSIRYEDSDGANTKNINNRYTRKNIDSLAFPQGEFVLSKGEVFDYPVGVEVNGNTMSLRVDWLKLDFTKKIKLSARFDAGTNKDIRFDTSEDFYETYLFFVDGIGYQDLQVKTWYDNVVLTASGNSKYSLRYELHRQVQLPEGVMPNAVHLDGFRLLIKVSGGSYELISQFIHGPTIKSMDKFFSHLDADLGDVSRTFNGYGNELLFTSNQNMEVRITDNVEGARSNTSFRSYIWNQDDDGTLFLKSPESNITIKFIKAIHGGYNILYRYPDGGYSRHDLILDAPSVVDEATFPGRYKFLSNNGWTVGEVVFHKDKTVTSSPNVVNGYWFQDTNGDIVSFECTTLARQDITNYADCYARFDRLSEMAFVHIRRLGFMHRDGDNYQMKYSASFYGDVFQTTTVDDDYLSAAWTYRWVRAGDE